MRSLITPSEGVLDIALAITPVFLILGMVAVGLTTLSLFLKW